MSNTPAPKILRRHDRLVQMTVRLGGVMRVLERSGVACAAGGAWLALMAEGDLVLSTAGFVAGLGGLGLFVSARMSRHRFQTRRHLELTEVRLQANA